MHPPFIQLKNISKKFGSQTILKELNLEINQGEIITIIGKSGEGKSVLLKHIIGLMEPDSGQILINGKQLSRLSKTEKKEIKKKFSYMFQSNALFDSMTIYENIALPLKEGEGKADNEIGERVRQKMEQLDLRDIDSKYPSQISGGMRKRVALARALVTDPLIVLFDEPTTGLDPIRKNAVHSMIMDYQQRFGFTAILVSHDIPDIFYISHRIAMLMDGKIFFEGTPNEIRMSENPILQQFVKGLESRHDALTDIAPKTHGEHRFNTELARLQRYQTIFSVVLFSIENMDEINEKAGHVAAQKLLRNFVSELQFNLRVSDICSRYGMDKIMVILPNTNLEEARMTCAKLSNAENIKNILDGGPDRDFCLSLSFGVAEAHGNSAFEETVNSALSVKNLLSSFTVC
ncbi:MAG: ATP-binding cassette domain-containing protein [Deltaproteobacteria bacterium]|nr:ATP-binding cassette domain-containing protein [Deltaproteobacteria bacterium]